MENISKNIKLYRILIFLSLGLMAALLNSSTPTPLYPIYQAKLNLTAVNLTAIYGAYAAGVLCSLLSISKLAHRTKDLRKLIIPALIIVFLGSYLFSISNSFISLCLGRLLAGVGTGALTGAANLALVKFTKNDNGKLAALIASFSFTLGLALGPIFSSVALHFSFYPTVTPFVVIMTIATLSIIGIFFYWPKNNVPDVNQNRKEGKHTPDKLIKALENAGSNYLLASFSLFFCWGIAAVILAVGPSISEKILHAQNSQIFGYLVAIYLLIAGFSQIICRKFEAEKSLKYGYIAQIISLFLYLVSIIKINFIFSLFGLAVGGYAYGAVFVGSATLVNKIVPKHNHAKLISVFYIIAYIANWIPLILGIFIDKYGLYTSSYYLLTCIIFISLGLLFTQTILKSRNNTANVTSI